MLSILMLLQAAMAPVAPSAVVPPCPATSPLSRWGEARPTASLPLGTPVELVATGVSNDPKRPGKAASAPFMVTSAGTYTIALGAPAWLDVVSAGKVALTSVAHGHGTCGGVRKLVAFKLTPGAYTLRVNGIAGDSVRAALLSGDQTGAGK